MKTKNYIFLSAVVALMLASCSSSDISNDSVSVLEDIQYNNEEHQNIESNNSNTLYSSDVVVSSTKVIRETLVNEGYSINSLVDTSSKTRGLDLEKYIYISNNKNSINVIGSFVCIISNGLGQKVLATLDAPKDFDIIEQSSELVLRGNLLEDNSRYTLSFPPTGFVNLNTTNTDPNSTIQSLLNQLKNSFNQFTLVNPYLAFDYLTYKINTQSEDGAILCNNIEFRLDTSKNIINFGKMFEGENLDVNCTTKNGILLGTIVSTKIIEGNISIPTKISGDLYRSMFENYERSEGDLSTNKSNVNFVNKIYNGQFGILEISSDGHWLYKLNIDMDIIKELKNNQYKKDIFQVKTIDAVEAEISITINGKDTIINGNLFDKVREEEKLAVSGKLSILYGSGSFIPQELSTKYGFIKLDSDGNWNYRLNMNLITIKKLKDNDLVKDIIQVQTTNDIQSYITIEFIFPTVTATGDYPIITYQLNKEKNIATDFSDDGSEILSLDNAEAQPQGTNFIMYVTDSLNRYQEYNGTIE